MTNFLSNNRCIFCYKCKSFCLLKKTNHKDIWGNTIEKCRCYCNTYKVNFGITNYECIPSKQHYIYLDYSNCLYQSKCKIDTCFICKNNLLHGNCKNKKHFIKIKNQIKYMEGCSPLFETLEDTESFNFLFFKNFKPNFESPGWPILVKKFFFGSYSGTSDEFNPFVYRLQIHRLKSLKRFVMISKRKNQFSYTIKDIQDINEFKHSLQANHSEDYNKEYFTGLRHLDFLISNGKNFISPEQNKKESSLSMEISSFLRNKINSFCQDNIKYLQIQISNRFKSIIKDLKQFKQLYPKKTSKFSEILSIVNQLIDKINVLEIKSLSEYNYKYFLMSLKAILLGSIICIYMKHFTLMNNSKISEFTNTLIVWEISNSDFHIEKLILIQKYLIKHFFLTFCEENATSKFLYYSPK